MKIGIDARLYGAQKNRGIGRYIEKLLEYLQSVDQVNQYYVFLLPDNFSLFKPTAENFHKVQVSIPWYSWSEQLIWPLILFKYHFDLVHFTHFNVPMLYWGCYMITLHDLIMTHYTDDRSTTKNKYLYRLKIWLARVMINFTAKRAKAVICPSEYTKSDVIKHLGLQPEKCFVIYEAVDQQIDDSLPTDNIVKKFSIYKPFFFYVGAAYPHKNLARLIEGFLQFNETGKYKLLLAGREDYFYLRLKDKYQQHRSIIFTGVVSEPELSYLYSQAVAFVFPSLIEGFGLPPLEAIKHHCPVVSSNTSCLPEVLAEAALYFDPTKTEAITTALHKIVSNTEVVELLQIKGLNRLKYFSWHKMAFQTAQVYKQFCKK